MLIAGENNGRFLKNKVAEKFCLFNTNNFHYYNHGSKQIWRPVCCAPRHDAAIGPRGADFVRVW